MYITAYAFHILIHTFQDVSAILRYFVKYGYNLNEDGYALLDKISIVLYRHLDTEPASKFTTNIKWLSVFYYYNEPLLARYIAIVRRDMKKLDFVALSDVLDTMAQVSVCCLCLCTIHCTVFQGSVNSGSRDHPV